MSPLYVEFLGFWKISRNPLAARDGGTSLAARRHMALYPVLGFLEEGPSGIGRTARWREPVVQFLIILCILGNFDRGKRKSYLIINDVLDYIIELRMVRVQFEKMVMNTLQGWILGGFDNSSMIVVNWPWNDVGYC